MRDAQPTIPHAHRYRSAVGRWWARWWTMRSESSVERVRRSQLEELIGAPIVHLSMYEHALRHRSLCRDGVDPLPPIESNERLEFLGDAILGAVIAEALYFTYPEEQEGFLTRVRAMIVNGKALAEVALHLGLGAYVSMSDQMRRAEGAHNASILADALEAIIGAHFLDQGMPAARRFVLQRIFAHWDVDELLAQQVNYKSRLLEFAQQNGWDQPRYDILQEEGPSHDPTFTVQVRVNHRSYGTATAKSKKAAEQRVARMALEAFTQDMSQTG